MRKCTNIKTSVMCNVCVKPSAYAKPQARDVKVRKRERRYVNDGSGRWYVLVVCFWTVSAAADGKHGIPYVVVYLSEDLLGRYDQAHDLPYSHLEVHLRELEQTLEEARHSDLIPAGRRGRGAKVG
jgi:hypothetical protein